MTDLHLAYRRIRDFGLANPVRSREFLSWVKSQPCITCGGAAEPHHFLGSTQSLKSSDLFTLPVCREHHRMLEDNPAMNHELIVDWAKLVHKYICGRLESEPPQFHPPEIPDCCCARCGARFKAGSEHICQHRESKR